MLPESGRVRPVIKSRKVLLPAPFGPMIVRSSPLIEIEVEIVNGLEAVEALVDSLAVRMKSVFILRLNCCSTGRRRRCRAFSSAFAVLESVRGCPRCLGHEENNQDKETTKDDQPEVWICSCCPALKCIDADRTDDRPDESPAPPTATQTTASSDFSGDISLGLMIPTCGV